MLDAAVSNAIENVPTNSVSITCTLKGGYSESPMHMIEMFIIYVGNGLYLYSGVGSLVVVAEKIPSRYLKCPAMATIAALSVVNVALRDECGQVTCLAVGSATIFALLNSTDTPTT